MTSEAPSLRERVAGSLYGLLVGDALGCPVEGMSAEDIAAEHGRLVDMVEPRQRWRPKGLHSDDGQQALALTDALLADPERLADGFARLLVDLLERGPRGFRRFGLHRGTGANFRQTVMALKNGRPIDEAALVTAGNGAAMRIAPAALYHRDDDDALLSAVVEASRVTHRDIRGIAAAGAVAFLVKDALVHDGPARALATPRLVERTRALEAEAARRLAIEPDERFSRALEETLDHLDDDVDELLGVIATLAKEGAEREVGPLDGYALASVTSSVALFLRSEGFEDVLTETVNLGGDADTTGAMVGQLAGALYGRRAIPDRWLDALIARGALEDRVDALVERRKGFTPGFSLVELERPWTALSLSREPAAKEAPAVEEAKEAPAAKEVPSSPPRVDERPAPSPAEELMAAVKAEREDRKAEREDGKAGDKKSQLSFFDLGPKPAAPKDASPQDTAAPPQPSLFGGPPTPASPIPTPSPSPSPSQSPTPSTSPSPAAPTTDLGAMAARITLVKGDLTEARVDAIVNAANSSLSGGGGVDGAIHRKGGQTLRKECEAIKERQGGCRTGDAVMTGAGDLPARHVIHAVGPRWRGGHQNERSLLESAYEASLELARNAGLRSVAFPSISTGAYRFPVDDAARIALGTLARYLERHPDAFDEVRLVLFDEGDLTAYRAAFRDVMGRDPPPRGDA